VRCASCGKDKPLAGHGWCRACYGRWWSNGKPASGPPPPRPHHRPFAVAGDERARLAKDLAARYEAGESTGDLASAIGKSKPFVRAILREAGATIRPTGRQPTYDAEFADGVIKRYKAGEDILAIADSLGRSYTFVHKILIRYGVVRRPPGGEKQRKGFNAFTDENRILWIVTRPGELNPFTCTAVRCTKLADPSRYFLCEMHARRLQTTGTLERKPCQRCGRELDGMSPFLCGRCYRVWRYCSDRGHGGERILPVAAMSNTTKCRACASAAQRRRNGSAVCERCGGWVNTGGAHSPKRTVCVSCWDGAEECAERSGECSQPSGRIIAGRCLAHYLRAYGQGRVTARPCLRFDACGGYATGGSSSLFCGPCVDEGWERCGTCSVLYQRPAGSERYANGKMKRRNLCTGCANAKSEAARRARGVRPARVARCGTLGGCDRHRRNGEPLCEECRAAWRDYRREYDRARGVRPREQVPHHGEDGHSSKLAWAQVREIRGRYAAGGITQERLAGEYGVTRSTVSMIVSGKTWTEPRGRQAAAGDRTESGAKAAGTSARRPAPCPPSAHTSAGAGCRAGG